MSEDSVPYSTDDEGHGLGPSTCTSHSGQHGGARGWGWSATGVRRRIGTDCPEALCGQKVTTGDTERPSLTQTKPLLPRPTLLFRKRRPDVPGPQRLLRRLSGFPLFSPLPWRPRRHLLPTSGRGVRSDRPAPRPKLPLYVRVVVCLYFRRLRVGNVFGGDEVVEGNVDK